MFKTYYKPPVAADRRLEQLVMNEAGGTCIARDGVPLPITLGETTTDVLFTHLHVTCAPATSAMRKTGRTKSLVWNAIYKTPARAL